MSANQEETVTQSITLLTVEPGGENEPGVYWSFDTEDDPNAAYQGPYASEDAAINSAKTAIEAAYKMAVEQLIGAAV